MSSLISVKKGNIYNYNYFYVRRVKDVSVLDIGTKFISEETIAKSYVFANNFKPSKGNTATKKEPKSKLLHYPHSSRLNVNQQSMCLKALQLLQSDRSIPFTSSEQQTINTYNVKYNLLVY